jgi:hypothetical protein
VAGICAVGLICLPLTQDPTATENELRALGAETIHYWPHEIAWVLRMLDTINRHRATAVVAPDMKHVADATWRVAI